MTQPSVTIPTVLAFIAGALAFVPTFHSLFAALLNRKTRIEVILFDTLFTLGCFGTGIYSFKLPLTIDIFIGAILAGGAILFVVRSPLQTNKAKNRWSVTIVSAFALTIIVVVGGANFAPSPTTAAIPHSTSTASPGVTASPVVTPPPHVTPSPIVTPSPPPSNNTYAETAGGGGSSTFTHYVNAAGPLGLYITGNATIKVSCRVTGWRAADGNSWWYRVASSPWNNAYYAPADNFYNNGQTSGSLVGTPWVDPYVPNC